jgi:hypothetical protein
MAKRPQADRKQAVRDPKLRWIGHLVAAMFHVMAIEPLSAGAARVLNTIPSHENILQYVN